MESNPSTYGLFNPSMQIDNGLYGCKENSVFDFFIAIIINVNCIPLYVYHVNLQYFAKFPII